MTVDEFKYAFLFDSNLLSLKACRRDLSEVIFQMCKTSKRDKLLQLENTKGSNNTTIELLQGRMSSAFPSTA